MELGQKIRAARQAAGLSQRALCGDVITRNMLSLIENGGAQPSMATLRHIAQRLEKPMGYFLEDEALTSPNQALMAQARQLWEAGDPRAVLDALAQFREPDGSFSRERDLLCYLSCLALARQALEGGRQPYARTVLAQAAQHRGPYITPALEGERAYLLALAGEGPAPTVDGVLLLQARQALEAALPHRALALLEAADHHGAPQWHLLAGLARFELGEYGPAERHLSQAENTYPAEAVPKLELCCRELGDFQRAYYYAKKQ